MTDAEKVGWAAAILTATGGVGGVLVKVFGSRKDRDAGAQEAAEEWRLLATEARERHEDCERRGEAYADAIEELRASVHSLEDRHVALAREHANCPSRDQFDELQDHVRRLSIQSTPPVGAYTPDDVRRALEESNG